MIVEHPDLPAQRVGSAVHHEWGIPVQSSRHLAVGSHSWHWAVGDAAGPQWFATLDEVRSSEQRRTRIAAFETAAQMSSGLSFVAAPVRTRDARIAVDLAPGLLLTLTPYLEGAPTGTGPFHDDAERAEVAALLARLHRQPRPRHLPRWRPWTGQASATRREDLERCLDAEHWTGGPWSGPTGRLVAEHRPVLRRSLRRFSLLAAAVTGNAESWVPTHGSPRPAGLVRTPGGPRLVDWGGLALAPRERDLWEVLGSAERPKPWFAYVEAGGSPDPLSPDTIELFAVHRHLARIADHLVQLSRPHEDTSDQSRHFGELESEVTALLERADCDGH